MATTQYIGARYVPLFAVPLDWSSDNTYEALTIVYYAGNSYTSRQAVPKGIDITNETYWALTGNYNAQIEAYRKEVAAMDGRVTENAQKIADEVSRAVAQETAIQKIIDTEKARAVAAETALGTRIDSVNSVISVAQEAPIYFSTRQLSDYQTVLITKIVKSEVEMELKQCNNVNESNTSDVINWLQDAGDEYIYAVNCDRWDTTKLMAYNNIINGTVHTDAGVASSTTNPNYFAFNGIDDIKFYNRNSMTINQIKSAGYNNAFVLGYVLMENGVDKSASATGDDIDAHEPQQGIAWNDDYIYIFTASGRSMYQQGITPQDIVNLAKRYECTDCAMLDGGGSVQNGLKLNGSMVKCNPSPSIPRKVPLALAFKVKDTSKKYLNVASLASIQTFCAKYQITYAPIIRTRWNDNLAVALPAKTDGFYTEKEVVGNAAESVYMSANAGDFGLPFDYSDTNKGIIWKTSGDGSNFNITALLNASIQFKAVNGGTFRGRIARTTVFADGTSTTVQVKKLVCLYAAGANIALSVDAGYVIPAFPDEVRETYFTFEVEPSTDITVLGFSFTENYSLGFM